MVFSKRLSSIVQGAPLATGLIYALQTGKSYMGILQATLTDDIHVPFRTQATPSRVRTSMYIFRKGITEFLGCCWQDRQKAFVE